MVRRGSIISILFLAILAVFDSPSYAALTPLEISQLEKEKINVPAGWEWSTRLENYRSMVSEKYGTDFAFVFNFAQQLILESRENQGKSRGVWYWNLEIAQRLWKGSKLFFELELDKGKGVDKFLPTFSEFNYNWGRNAFYVPALYLEQNFLDDKIYTAGGKLDLTYWFDLNEAANSADTQFLSSALVNNLAIPFPQKGIGALAGVKPYEWLYLQLGAATARASYTRVGLSNAFNSAFFVAEAGWTPRLHSLPGNYRFLIYGNHEKLAYINSEDETKNNIFGWALSFDQAVNKHLTLFCRYGSADAKVWEIAHFWSCGAQLTEPLPGRKFDTLGFGVAQSIFGKDFREANGEDTALGETKYEIYYCLGINNSVSFTPDLQIVTNPDADKTAKTEVVIGLRFLLNF